MKEIDELLKIVEEDSENVKNYTSASTPRNKEEESVFKFLKEFNIQEGITPILGKNLYKVYKDWTSTPVVSNVFIRVLHRCYPKNAFSQFLINIDSMNISPYALEHYLYKKPLTSASIRMENHFNNFCLIFKIRASDKWSKFSDLYNLYFRWIFGLGFRQAPIKIKQFKELLHVKYGMHENSNGCYVKVEYEKL